MTKRTDTRARKFGSDISVELDAIPPGKAFAELRKCIGATVKPIAARALLRWLMAKRPDPICTFDLRRIALASAGFPVRRSRKDRTVDWIDAFCHWIKTRLRDLPPDERQLLDDIFADAFAPEFWERLTKATVLISEVRILGDAPRNAVS